MKKPARLSAADLKAVARFRTLFAEGFSPGKWEGDAGSLPMFFYSQEVRDLMRALYEHSFVVAFSWPTWRDEAKRYLDDPTQIKDAPIGDIQRLFTTLVRTDRFSEGSFAAYVESGVVLALLARVEVLAREPR